MNQMADERIARGQNRFAAHGFWMMLALQVLVLAVSGLMLYRDVVRARNKQARRARRQEVARSRAAFERALEQKNAPARRRTVCA